MAPAMGLTTTATPLTKLAFVAAPVFNRVCPTFYTAFCHYCESLSLTC
jgi:hypothetical protein